MYRHGALVTLTCRCMRTSMIVFANLCRSAGTKRVPKCAGIKSCLILSLDMVWIWNMFDVLNLKYKRHSELLYVSFSMHPVINIRLTFRITLNKRVTIIPFISRSATCGLTFPLVFLLCIILFFYPFLASLPKYSRLIFDPLSTLPLIHLTYILGLHSILVLSLSLHSLFITIE